tara:strand:- start:20689 stop:21636 length:948 start_codon:yes stop_codon:yes gene_type:complete
VFVLAPSILSLLIFLIAFSASSKLFSFDGAPGESQVSRGLYLAKVAGCISCHTDTVNNSNILGGGREIKSPYGSFFSPNITPDLKNGIGNWTNKDFIKAVRYGIRPKGGFYYPVFPYTSYKSMSDRDILDIKSWIEAQKPLSEPNKPHQISFPASWRNMLGPWRWLFFDEESTRFDFLPDNLARGAYLVEALGHCGECHTPRNMFGAQKSKKLLAGSRYGPSGNLMPNISPDKITGIGKWTESELVFFLKTGLKPNGDYVNNEMAEIIQNSLQHLSDYDIRSISSYLNRIKPSYNNVRVRRKNMSIEQTIENWWD